MSVMSSTALTSAGQQTRTIAHPDPLLRVMAWELRRFRASRLFWWQALGLFCFMLLLIWALRAPDQFGSQIGTQGVTVFVAGTSAWGLLHTLPLILVLLVVLLPFVTADGVTRDLNRRTHELLMTTALPTWAYVWGRYLVGLLVSLGLAVLLLASILGMGVLAHLTIPAYPLPQLDSVLLLWLGMVVPAVFLVSSLSFALSTLLPRLSMLVKVVVMVAWILGAVMAPAAYNNTVPPAWYVNWDPTSAITARGLLPVYENLFDPLSRTATSAAQLEQTLLAIENKLPDLAGWFAPHLLLGGLSLALVLIASLAYKRSRNALR